MRSLLMTGFLYRFTEKHDVADTEFLVDAVGYLTALARHELSGQLNYTDRDYIERSSVDWRNQEH